MIASLEKSTRNLSDQPEEPLRARKRRRIRQHIIGCAAALFHERGFERVTVADIARAAEVGEQTIYNHFSTKEALVFDEADEFADRFAAMAGERSPGASLIEAVRREAHAFLDSLANRPANPHPRGGMPYLVATSSVVRRGWLALVERYSRIVAEALVARGDGHLGTVTAGAIGWAVVAIFAVIVHAVGETVRDDGDVEALIGRLRPQIDAALDLLDHGLGAGDL
jgi:AcrR family transcriptional regulator